MHPVATAKSDFGRCNDWKTNLVVLLVLMSCVSSLISRDSCGSVTSENRSLCLVFGGRKLNNATFMSCYVREILLFLPKGVKTRKK